MRLTRATLIALATLLAATLAAPATAQDPYTRADDSWISISGEVADVTSDSFELDYGDGTVTVETDDWSSDPEGYKVIEGDKVTVSGMIDDDVFETTKIEAATIYVENLNTYFTDSSSADEEDLLTLTTPVPVSTIVVQGTVTDVDGREITIDSGLREVRVDTSSMAYNPLDDEGFQQIEVGDRVNVSGAIDADFFEGREIEADSIITLSSSDESMTAKSQDETS